jgi:hypothetical protein
MALLVVPFLLSDHLGCKYRREALFVSDILSLIVNYDCRYESIAKGQLVSPSLSQHAVMPKQVNSA